MTYKSGSWGPEQKERSKRRREYFREYRRLHPQRIQYVSYGTSLGYRGELLAQEILKGSERINRPSDLKWEGKLVEVKTARKQLLSNKNIKGKRILGSTYRWKFLLTHQRRRVDLFFFICKDTNDKVEYILLIPDEDLRFNNLSITEHTIKKYSKYLLTLL